MTIEKNNPILWVGVTAVVSITVGAIATWAISHFSRGVDAASEDQIEQVIMRMNVTPQGESFGKVLDDHGDKLDAVILKLDFVEKSLDRLAEE